jgi:hypothetical protein
MIKQPFPTTSPTTTSPITTSPITTSPITISPTTTSTTISPTTISPTTTSPITTSPITTSPITTSPPTWNFIMYGNKTWGDIPLYGRHSNNISQAKELCSGVNGFAFYGSNENSSGWVNCFNTNDSYPKALSQSPAYVYKKY